MLVLRRFIPVILFLTTQLVFGQNTKENADFKLAINLYNDGLYDLAEEQLKQFISSYPNTSQGVDARFTLGQAQLKLKKYEEARLTFQTFALTYQDNPKAPDAWWNVGEAFAALKNYKDAALAYERVKVFHPKSTSAADALVHASSFFELVGERDNARRVLRVVLQEYPASNAAVAARTQLARMYIADGSYEQARNELKRVVDSDPSPDAKAQALLLSGQVDQALGRADHAESAYREILSKFKTTPALRGAHVALGGLLAASGNHQAALDEFHRALNEKGPTDSTQIRDAQLGIADAERALTKYTDAAASYDRFLATYPQDARSPEVLWKLAATAAGAHNYKKSTDACNRLLKSDAPDLLKRRALVQIARNAQAQGNAAAAIQTYGTFVDLYPDDKASPLLALTAAHTMEQDLHDSRKAATSYEILVNRFPNAAVVDDALFGAARCHEQLKEYDRALPLYRELIVRYPASELRSDAETRMTWMETFEIKEKDAGLEQLAMLVGDVVANRDKSALAFRLGGIYFNNLKNYEAAAQQLSNALASGLPEGQQADALFLRARSYELLTLKDPQYRPQAVEAFEQFINTAPKDPRADDAALRLFHLQATTLATGEVLAESLLTRKPGFGRKDALFFRLGVLATQNDSIALTQFHLVTDSSPGSPLADDARYAIFDLLLKKGLADSAGRVGITYLHAHPDGRHTALLLARLIPLLAGETTDETAADYAAQLWDRFPYTTAATNARMLQAGACMNAHQWEPALALYTQLLHEQESDVLSDGEPDTGLLSDLATASMNAGNTAQAKKYYLQFLKRVPSGESAGYALTMLGFIARKEGLLDLANGYFRQAMIAAPQAAANPDVASILFANAAYADARTQFLALSTQSDSLERRVDFEAQAIVCLYRLDDLDQAEKASAAFAKKYKEDVEHAALFEVERATGLFRAEKYPQALQVLDKVIDKRSTTTSMVPALYWRGKTLAAMNKPQEAVEQLNALLKDYPGSALTGRTHMALGNIFYQIEKWDEAIRHYRTFIDDNASDPALLAMAMSNLIETYETAGLNDAALSLTRHYLELYPNNDDSFDKQIKVGILYERLGYFDQAVLHLQALLDEAGSDLEGEIRYYIGEANFGKGDYQQAILDFLKVPYLVTKKGKIDWTATSLYMAGQAYEKMSRYDQALTMYQQIVDRPGIDATFKTAARKEVDRVSLVLKKKPK